MYWICSLLKKWGTRKVQLGVSNNNKCLKSPTAAQSGLLGVWSISLLLVARGRPARQDTDREIQLKRYTWTLSGCFYNHNIGTGNNDQPGRGNRKAAAEWEVIHRCMEMPLDWITIICLLQHNTIKTKWRKKFIDFFYEQKRRFRNSPSNDSDSNSECLWPHKSWIEWLLCI